MAKKMYYTEEETAAALGIGVGDLAGLVNQLASALRDVRVRLGQMGAAQHFISSDLEGDIFEELHILVSEWSGRPDLNRRPLGPEPSALAKLSHAPTRHP